FLVLFAGIHLTLFDLLGTFIIFLDVLLYAVISGFDRIGWQIILFLLFVAIIVESIDFFLVVKGGYQPALKRKRVFITLAGAVAGAFILAPFFGGAGMWGGFFLCGFFTMMALEFAKKKQQGSRPLVSSRAIFTMGLRKLFKGVMALIMIAVSLSNIYS
ncbi:MAG: DUF456 family protein, partial [Syntrophaceae bacterium]|nr:DUF456 family protein [Syntrophaceae bacterium]